MAEVEKKRLGAPSKLTPETQQQIVLAVSTGAYMETAAAFAGVHKDTLYDWMKRGRAALKVEEAERTADEQRHVDFLISMEKAMADSELRDLSTIATASAEHWQAAAWRLERRFPERWRRRETHEVVAEGSDAMRSLADVEAELEELEPGQIDARLAVYDQVKGELDAGPDQ